MKNDTNILLLFSGGVIVLDQITKVIIRFAMDEGTRIWLIPNFLAINSHRNYGGAWGIFQGQLTFFVIMTLIALGLFSYLAKDINFKGKKCYSIAIALLIGGTLGNFIDRLVPDHGVVDFIDFYIFTYNFPIFNVADIALTFGMILFAFDILFLEGARHAKSLKTNN